MYPASEPLCEAHSGSRDEGDECEWEKADAQMCNGQTDDLEDTHQDLGQEEEVVKDCKCLLGLCARTGLASAFCRQLLDLDLLSSLATMRLTAAERIQGLVRNPT